jgi:hypothetical protein
MNTILVKTTTTTTKNLHRGDCENECALLSVFGQWAVAKSGMLLAAESSCLSYISYRACGTAFVNIYQAMGGGWVTNAQRLTQAQQSSE